MYLAALAALIYWGMSLRPGHSWARTGIKGLALLPLVPLALLQGAVPVAIALLLCSLGDMVLSRPGERAFLGGLIAFALGHLGWIAVFWTQPGLSWTALAGLWPLALVVALAMVIMARVLLPHAGALRGPVAAYICIIAAMAFAGLAAGDWGIILGAFLFMGSDALLGLQTFVLAGGSRAERVANALIWPLYWLAVLCLTLNTLSL